MRRGFAALILFCFASLLSFAAHGESADARHGSLYRIHHHGHTAWLFGTIHVGTATVDPLGGEAGAALAKADRLVLEADVENGMAIQAALVAHALYGPGDNIGKHLSKAALDRLRKAAAQTGIPFKAITGMKPWFVADLLMLKDLERHGYSADDAAELRLARYAEAHGKPVGELESAEFQLGLFDSLSEAKQEQYLLQTIAEIESGKAAKDAATLFDAWMRADEAALRPLLKEMEGGSAMEFVRRELLEKRNPAMAEKIAAMMEDGDRIFVAIGWLHLVGRNSVPEWLRRRGYEVKRIY